MKRYLMTATLLNNWKYYTESEYGNKESFMQTLTRQPEEDKQVFIEGRLFEDWAVENYEPTLNGVYQLRAYRDWDKYLLYGRIDCLKAGVIYDYKRSKSYAVGHYLGSPQTSMYFDLIPEAKKFEYVIYGGTLGPPRNIRAALKEVDGYEGISVCVDESKIMREVYARHEVEPIQRIVKDFEQWLKAVGLWQVYTEHWEALS